MWHSETTVPFGGVASPSLCKKTSCGISCLYRLINGKKAKSRQKRHLRGTLPNLSYTYHCIPLFKANTMIYLTGSTSSCKLMIVLVDRRCIINMPQFYLHHRIEPKEVQPWESDLWDIIIIHRVLIRITGLMLCILNEKGS